MTIGRVIKMSKDHVKKIDFDIEQNKGKQFLILSSSENIPKLAEILEKGNFTNHSDFTSFDKYSMFDRHIQRYTEGEAVNNIIENPFFIICDQDNFDFDVSVDERMEETISRSRSADELQNRYWIAFLQKYNYLFNEHIRFVFLSSDASNPKDPFLKELTSHNVKDIFNFTGIKPTEFIGQLTEPPRYENIKAYASRDRSKKFDDIEYVPIDDKQEFTNEPKGVLNNIPFVKRNRQKEDKSEEADVTIDDTSKMAKSDRKYSQADDYKEYRERDHSDIPDVESEYDALGRKRDAESDDTDDIALDTKPTGTKGKYADAVNADGSKPSGFFNRSRVIKLSIIGGLVLILIIIAFMFLSGGEEQPQQQLAEETVDENTNVDEGQATETNQSSDDATDSENADTLEEGTSDSASSDNDTDAINPLTAIYRDYALGNEEDAIRALSQFNFENFKQLDIPDMEAIAYIYGTSGYYEQAVDLYPDITRPVSEYITNELDEGDVQDELEALQSVAPEDDKLELQVAGYEDDFDTVLELYEDVDIEAEDTDIQKFVVTALIAEDEVGEAESFLEDYDNAEADDIIAEYNDNEEAVQDINSDIGDLKEDMADAENIDDTDERESAIRDIERDIRDKQNELRELIVQ